jgi:SAM-dependent methyltransferase
MNCRHCQNKLEHLFLDLGFAPPSNAYRLKEDLQKPEMMYPLRIFVCDKCWLVQTEDFVNAEELFSSEYAYFSSTSSSWLDHAAKYCEMIQKKLSLNFDSLVVEVASNDGYLLKNFVEAGILCLGIEPTKSTANAAKKLGIPVQCKFFGTRLAEELTANGKQADLIIGNNVYAHVPDINDFTLGLKRMLKHDGTITLEFAYLLKLIRQNEFDTVYHEHFSYLSLHAVKSIFEGTGLKIYDVEELTTHGGSLRVYGCHEEARFNTTERVYEQLQKEEKAGLLELKTYVHFQQKAERVKNDLLAFLIEQKRNGKKVAAYGAAAKGNTLLNYAGVKPDLLSFVCDAASAKQNKFMPGSHIPILPPTVIAEEKPDFVVILPWNIADEVMRQNELIRQWGGKFVTAVPKLELQ